MKQDRAVLEAMMREQLIAKALEVGVVKPEVLTRIELVDEILRLGTPDRDERRRVRGWLGVARDLLASIVEQGLNLPDAAALIRGDVSFKPVRAPQAPVATVTLAEIYGAQGHFERAVEILDEVLSKEPEHRLARKLRDQLQERRGARSAAPAQDAVPAHVADDAVVLLCEPPSTLVYYELSGQTRRRASQTPDARLVVRLLEFRPYSGGAECITRELGVDGSDGVLRVDGIAPKAVVRGALGLAGQERFLPVAVAAEIAPGAQEIVSWKPRPRLDVEAVARRAAERFGAVRP
jgi:hypothetical protein